MSSAAINVTRTVHHTHNRLIHKQVPTVSTGNLAKYLVVKCDFRVNKYGEEIWTVYVV